MELMYFLQRAPHLERAPAPSIEHPFLKVTFSNRSPFLFAMTSRRFYYVK